MYDWPILDNVKINWMNKMLSSKQKNCSCIFISNFVCFFSFFSSEAFEQSNTNCLILRTVDLLHAHKAFEQNIRLKLIRWYLKYNVWAIVYIVYLYIFIFSKVWDKLRVTSIANFLFNACESQFSHVPAYIYIHKPEQMFAQKPKHSVNNN